MRVGLILIIIMLSFTLHADEIGSGPGDAKTGEPSEGCGPKNKDKMTVINFRCKAEKPEDAKDDFQEVKRDDGWHLNDFEGEDIYFDKDGKPCITSCGKTTCGAAIGTDGSSWRDKDGIKRHHQIKIEYNPENTLTITMLDENGKPDPTMPKAHVQGSGVIKATTASNGASNADAKGGTLTIHFFPTDDKQKGLTGFINAPASKDGNTPVADPNYITPNKLQSTPQKGSSNSSVKADKTVMPDSKNICEAQGICGWTADVNDSNMFKKTQLPKGDSGSSSDDGSTKIWGPAHGQTDYQD